MLKSTISFPIKQCQFLKKKEKVNHQISPTLSVLLQMFVKLRPSPSLGLEGTKFPMYYSSKCTVKPS